MRDKKGRGDGERSGAGWRDTLVRRETCGKIV